MLAEIIGGYAYRPATKSSKSALSLTFEFSDGDEKQYYIARGLFVGASKLVGVIDDHSKLANRIHLVDEVNVSLSRSSDTLVRARGKLEIIGRLDDELAGSSPILHNAYQMLHEASPFVLADLIWVSIELREISFERPDLEKRSFLVT